MTVISGWRSSFAHAPQALKLVWTSAPVGSVILGLLTLLAAAVPLAVAWVGKAIIDAVVAGSDEAAVRLVLGEFALIVAQVAILRGVALTRHLVGGRLGIDINVAILEKALSLQLPQFEDSDTYDRLTRARREASTRPLSMVSQTFLLVQNGLTLAGYITILVSFSPWAAMALALAAFPATAAEMRSSQAAFRLRNRRSPELRRLNYIEYVLGNDKHAKEVKLFALGPMLLSRYRSLGEQLFREERFLTIRRVSWAYALSLLASGALYVCYAVVALQAARRAISLGEMTLYVVAFRQGQQAFQSILAAIGTMYEDNLYMSNLFAFLAIPTARPELPATSALGEEKGIRFENVGFRYPDAEQWALRNVNVFIAAGSSLALVGHNGAGKTTFVKLLTRLYEPSEGRIVLDGRDLRCWDENELRARIGVIFQDFSAYQLNVRENVGVGSVDHIEDETRLWRAVDAGGATQLVLGFKRGLDTPLGRWFQEGVELSGGQWQTIALSRAFMREEADILILDEPTAALDAEAEQQIFERFRTLAWGKTSILISHRFPTVRMADRIIVLENGQVIEEGNHTELVDAGARYARLFALQAQGYRR